MAWWLVKECCSAMIRPLSPFGGCVAVKFSRHHLLIFTNHHRFMIKHDVVISERVFLCNDKIIMAYFFIWWVCGCEILHHFCNDKTIMAYCSVWWVFSYEILNHCELLLIFTNHHRFKHGMVVSERVFFCNDKTIIAYCSIWWV